MSTGPTPSNTNSNSTPSTSTRSRLLLSSLPPTTPVATTSATSTAVTSTPSTNKPSTNDFPLVDEKLFSRYSNNLVTESARRRMELADHTKRLNELRKETEFLDQTDWMYEPVEKLLGK